ncbi:TetR/AcrR family transcriptional regulator [Nocardia sp. BMG111209]|uniref:TetR/AcrR family transcriptional regulator n=1 Tax=Nocardia sp. BMG111209 TaxID=1160137 RepID=UPI0003738016|nr:TetR/AcrR family transcriptional regulator [Nocardia sp. BMG111209]
MAYRRTPAVQARLDAQQQQIVRAAASVLARSGYGGLSMAAVAAAAGVATGTVYGHFAGKSELVGAVFRQVVEREVAVVSAVTAEGAALERLVAGVETFAGRALKNPRLAYAMLAEPVDAAVDAQRLHYRQVFAQSFEAAIRAGMAGGEIAGQDPRISAAALVGAIAEVMVGPLSQRSDDDPEPAGADRVVAELVAFALRAVGAPESGGYERFAPGRERPGHDR